LYVNNIPTPSHYVEAYLGRLELWRVASSVLKITTWLFVKAVRRI
jgi:hypothetical protein